MQVSLPAVDDVKSIIKKSESTNNHDDDSDNVVKLQRINQTNNKQTMSPKPKEKVDKESSTSATDNLDRLPFFIDPNVQIPSDFKIVNNLLLMHGSILLRVTSKVLFRKWKPVFFVLTPKKLQFFMSQQAWKLNHDPIKSFDLSTDLIVTAVRKNTSTSLGESYDTVFSVCLDEKLGIDDPKLTTSTTFVSQDEIGLPASSVQNEEFNKLVKFGSKSEEDIEYLSNAVKCIVLCRDATDLTKAQQIARRRSTLNVKKQ